nr:hypothetical protein [Tanacetum cinerariifolium]
MVPAQQTNAVDISQPTQLATSGPTTLSGQATNLAHAFSTTTLQDLASGTWNMDTCASSHLNNSVTSLNKKFNVSFSDVTARGIFTQLQLHLLSPHAFFVSQHTWHQRLGHPGGEVLRHLISSNFISYNNGKPPVLCHACQLGKHVTLPFVSSNTVISSCFDIIHSDVWTSPILSLSVLDQHAPAIIQNLPVNPNPDSVHPMVTRFRVGTNRPTERLNLHVSSVSPLLKSYRDAFNDPNWQNAMRDEYTALIKNKTWTLVPRPSDTNIVHCMWLFRHKYLADGTLSRYKARLVKNGSTQLEGVDVDEAFRLLNRPLGFWDSVHPDYVCLLQRSLYGLKQVPRAWFQRSLHQEFAMTDLVPLNYFLGISVTRDSSGLFLSQKKYALEILDRALMANCNTSRTLIDIESKLKSDGDLVSDPTLYQNLAGCLFKCRLGWLSYYSTFDFGYCVFLGNNLLSWSSKRQPTLSRSSAEAEYRGVANAVAETCWLRNLLRELHTPLSSAMLVYCDNVSAVYLSCNLVQHQRTKHIEIDIHFVRDLVATGQVRVLPVPFRYQFADFFTKGLSSALFEEFRSSLSVPPAPTAGEC